MQVSDELLHIGGNAVWGEYFAGLIDNVRIYNRALTVGQIQTDMNAPVVSGAAGAMVASGPLTDVETAEAVTAAPVKTAKAVAPAGKARPKPTVSLFNSRAMIERPWKAGNRAADSVGGDVGAGKVW
jgi:hypothetical protein